MDSSTKINNKMTWFEKIAFGSGNMGICLCSTMVTAFIMYFYTNVVHISVLKVGTIMLIGGIVEGVANAVMGVIVDHTRTKWGKCRPYLIFMAIPTAAIIFLVFHVPNASPAAKYLYALITYVAYTLIYTLVLVPQNVLLTAITNDRQDRVTTNMCGTLGTNFGQLIPNACALAIVGFLGHGSEYKGFGLTVLIFGICGAALMLFDGLNTHERMNTQKVIKQKISTMDTIRSMKNVPWIICAVTMLFAIAQVVAKSSTTVYYSKFVLDSKAISSVLLSITNIIGIPVALVIPLVAKKISNHYIVIMGAVIGIIGNIGLLFSRVNHSAIIAFAVIAAIGTAFINGIIYVMCAEAVDYGEWKQGVRVQGFLMAFIGFGVQIGDSIIQMIVSEILNKGGYNGAAQVQNLASIHSIEFCYVWIPIILLTVIFVINLVFYKLDKMYPQIKQDLEAKREQA